MPQENLVLKDNNLRHANNRTPFSDFACGLWRVLDWNISTAELVNLINEYIELGVTTFDHADLYGNYQCEGVFGKALKELDHNTREKMQIITKCGIKAISPQRPSHKVKHYDTSKEHIVKSIDNSLKELNTEYIDALLIHRPDPFMSADETAEAFHLLKQSGKVLHFGVSNFLPDQMELLSSRLDFPLITNQIELSLLNFDAFYNGTLNYCQTHNITPTIWSPLGGGKLFNSEDKQIVKLREELEAIGSKHDNCSIDQVALAWLNHHPTKPSIILGTGSIDRIKSAIKSRDIKLSREDWFSIWTAAGNKVV